MKTCACCGQPIRDDNPQRVQVDPDLLLVCNRAHAEAERRASARVEVAHLLLRLAKAPFPDAWYAAEGLERALIEREAEAWLQRFDERVTGSIALQTSPDVKALLRHAEGFARIAGTGFAGVRDLIRAVAHEGARLETAAFAVGRCGGAPAVTPAMPAGGPALALSHDSRWETLGQIGDASPGSDGGHAASFQFSAPRPRAPAEADKALGCTRFRGEEDGDTEPALRPPAPPTSWWPHPVSPWRDEPSRDEEAVERQRRAREPDPQAPRQPQWPRTDREDFAPPPPPRRELLQTAIVDRPERRADRGETEADVVRRIADERLLDRLDRQEQYIAELRGVLARMADSAAGQAGRERDGGEGGRSLRRSDPRREPEGRDRASERARETHAERAGDCEWTGERAGERTAERSVGRAGEPMSRSGASNARSQSHAASHPSASSKSRSGRPSWRDRVRWRVVADAVPLAAPPVTRATPPPRAPEPALPEFIRRPSRPERAPYAVARGEGLRGDPSRQERFSRGPMLRALQPALEEGPPPAADNDADDDADIGGGDRLKRFYLSPDDDIVKAPSIGPRTAARLNPAGLMLVRDLLACDPVEVATRTGARYITASRIADWKAQARLVCTIPWLRGTHAQLLVGAGYDTLHKLMRAEPSSVCGAILRFAATREGQSILRSGPPPEIDRIACWIENTALAEPGRAA